MADKTINGKCVHEKFCDERHEALEKIDKICVERIEDKIEALDKEMKLRFDNISKALNISSEETNRRLEQLNQLRGEVTKDRDMFLRKETYDVKTTFYDTWVTEVNEKLVKLLTKYNDRMTVPVAVSIVSAIIALLSFFLMLFRTGAVRSVVIS